MRIAKVTLQGFRSFKERIEISLGPFTTIVGKNDTGKSSILYALDAFFNSKLDEADFNRDQGPDDPIVIEVSFTDLPPTIQVEEGIDTTLVEENLLDEHGFLTVKRVFTKKNLKKPKTFIVASDYTDTEYQNPCSLKEAQLNEKGRALSLDFKKSGAGITNKSKREAIRKKAIERNEAKETIEFEPDEGLLKLLDHLPEFNLFQADFRLSEEETSFQREFKAVIETAVSKIPGRSDIEKGVEQEIDNEVSKIHQCLLQHTDEVASIKARPSFKWKDLVSFYLECEDRQGKSIQLGKRGAGLRRLLMVAYFQYLAQRESVPDRPRTQIYGIEEPETYLQPGAQRTLLRSFETIASRDQVLVTSHSPVFAGSTDISSVVLVTRENGVTKVQQGEDVELEKVAKELGVEPSDQVFGFKGCIFVEGEKDIEFLEAVAKILKEAGHIPRTLSDVGVGIIAFGGSDNLRHWITRNSLKRINRRYAILIDSDRKLLSDNVPQRKLNWKKQCEDEGGLFFITKKRELENYLHREAIKKDRGKDDAFDDFTDMKARFGDNVITAVKHMSADHILERDKYVENGQERHEILEIIQACLSLVET